MRHDLLDSVMAQYERRSEELRGNRNIENTQAISELINHLIELEKTIIYIVAKLALDQPIDLDDPVFEKFLHLKGIEDRKRAALEVIAHFSVKQGGKAKLVECPNCHAKIKDVPGVTDEICTWCGHQLYTDD